MPEDVPGRTEETGLVLQDANGSVFRESAEERAAAWSAIEPDEQRDGAAARFVQIVPHGSEQLIVHAAGALGPIPIDLLISFVDASVPAKDWKSSGSVELRLFFQKSVVLKVASAAWIRKNSRMPWIYFIPGLESRFILYSARKTLFFLNEHHITTSNPFKNVLNFYSSCCKLPLYVIILLNE